eukprot:197928_1
MNIKVTIKHGKKKYKNIEMKSGSSFKDIQNIIFSLTSVPPNRQKIIIAGKKVRNDNDMTKLIKNKTVLIVMGSAQVPVSTNNQKTHKFVEMYHYILSSDQHHSLVNGYIHRIEILFKKKQIIPDSIYMRCYQFYQPNLNIVMDSLILTDKEKNTFKHIICKQKYKLTLQWKLIYRASRDGFKYNDFTRKCDGICNTLSIIRTANNNVFGGFTRIAWSTNNKRYTDPDAFLILLRSTKNYAAQSFNYIGCMNGNAVHHVVGSLCRFGWELIIDGPIGYGRCEGYLSQRSPSEYDINPYYLNSGEKYFEYDEMEVFSFDE